MKVGHYETDKDLSGYVDTYRGLSQTMPRSPAICELGVYRGGSLAFWQEMFPDPDTLVVGVDIDVTAVWPPGTVKIVADQQDPTLPQVLTGILAEHKLGHGGYDLIVDDASHQGQPTYKALQHLWPLVRPGGYYVIEDWCVWNGHHGNYDDSMLSVAMMLLKFFDGPDTEIHFVTFSYGLIIIRKKDDLG